MKKFVFIFSATTMLITSIISTSFAYNPANHPIIHETGSSLRNTKHKEQNRIENRVKKHQRNKGRKQIAKGNKLIQKGQKEYQKGAS